VAGIVTRPEPGPRPGPAITSPANPHVKRALSLRDRRERDRTGLTIVDGGRELRRAVEAGVDVVEAFVDEVRCDDNPDCRAAVEALPGWASISGVVAARLAYGDRFEGVVAVVRQPSTALDSLELPDEPLIVVLDGVEKPGNVGAILRSADAAGADAVLLADPRTDPFNPNVIRASLGTVFTVPFAAGPSSEVLACLVGRRIRVVAARVDAARLYTEADLRGPLAIVLGSEAEGLGGAWSGAAVDAVRVPMLGIADSLNVAATAAVLLFEARRQRGLPGERETSASA
jgi:TrmH family RNA methyltransferase